jgi:hypothetical protein
MSPQANRFLWVRDKNTAHGGGHRVYLITAFWEDYLRVFPVPAPGGLTSESQQKHL